MAQRPGDKIIMKAAREILKPMGLFQVGMSRIWIDDNDWFLTVIEFQPSSWSKGAYLNVGISFLWEQGNGFSEVLPYNIGGREAEHITYEGNDEAFSQNMLEMSLQAKQHVLKYRELFVSPSSSVEQIKTYCDANNPMKIVTLWNQAMCYYLFDEETAGDSTLQNLMLYAQTESKYISGGKEYIREWVVEMAITAENYLSCKEKRNSVVNSIVAKRQRLRNKSSYRRMPISEQFS